MIHTFVQGLHAAPHQLAACLLVVMFMSSCSSSHDIPRWFDSIQRLPVRSISIHGQRMAYLDQGTGSPVILIHGYGGSVWQWEYQQAALAARYRVITPDLIGFGFSDKPDVDYTPEYMVEFFHDFMKELGLERVSLVGNSMGGGVAIALALTYPDMIDRLVLISGFPPRVKETIASPVMKRAMNIDVPLWVVELWNRLFFSSSTDSVMKEIVFDHTLLTPAVMERSKRNRLEPGIFRPIISLRDNLPQWEAKFAPRLHAITHSTLILWGEEDRLFPAHVGRDMALLIPRSTLHLIPRAGHIPQWERPDIVNGFLLSFLES